MGPIQAKTEIGIAEGGEEVGWLMVVGVPPVGQMRAAIHLSRAGRKHNVLEWPGDSYRSDAGYDRRVVGGLFAVYR